MDLYIPHVARDLAVNLVAITVLAYGLYFRRHGRRELLVGYVAFNVSLFAVAAVLGSAVSLTIGFGFGLFAVLSIVRLRSDETNQGEIGYTMVSLVLGLIMGLPGVDFELKVLFAVLLITAMYVVDSPVLFPEDASGRHRVVLESVMVGRPALIAELERRLGGTVRSLIVREVDYVRETTEVDVRMVYHRKAAAPAEDDTA